LDFGKAKKKIFMNKPVTHTQIQTNIDNAFKEIASALVTLNEQKNYEAMAYVANIKYALLGDIE